MVAIGARYAGCDDIAALGQFAGTAGGFLAADPDRFLSVRKMEAICSSGPGRAALRHEATICALELLLP